MSDTTEHESLNGTNQMRKRRLRILALLIDNTLWKKQVGQRFEESVQTIGRDVDALYDDGLLTQTILNTEDGGHSTCIGYTTTEHGANALKDYRICQHCGNVVRPDRECVHDYVPLSETTAGGGD